MDYSTAALLDIHGRTHQSLAGLLAHAAGFSADELSRAFEGFGIGSIRAQLHHMIGAEAYWLSVLHHAMDVEEDEADYESIAALQDFREKTYATTRRYLEHTSEEDLNSPDTFRTWPDNEKELVPARVILRTQMHIYQHQGQVTAMSRILGRPVNGLDFPIV